MGKRSYQHQKARKAMRNGAAVALVTLSSVSMFRAVAATATLPIVAKIIRAVEITINTSLNFGTLAVTQDVASVGTIDPSTNDLRVNGEGGLSLAGGKPSAGSIRIRGANMPVRVSVATNNVQLTNGTTFLTINNFNFDTASGGHQVTVTPTGPDNSVLVSVGASINTRARQLSGTYVGSSTIFANYQ